MWKVDSSSGLKLYQPRCSADTDWQPSGNQELAGGRGLDSDEAPTPNLAALRLQGVALPPFGFLCALCAIIPPGESIP